MSARHERFAASAVPSIKAMDWPDATAASHLFAAMTAEIAIRELDAGRRLPAARRSLRRFLGGDRTGAQQTAQL
jgi:TetR/AcrR family transcriptional regulator, transcriptional repressor for nem operon